jgi:hypothetical protein
MEPNYMYSSFLPSSPSTRGRGKKDASEISYHFRWLLVKIVSDVLNSDILISPIRELLKEFLDNSADYVD